MRNKIEEVSSDLNLVKEPVEEALRQLMIREKECQDIENKTLSLRNLHSPSYADVVRNNLEQESPRRNAENNAEFESRQETEVPRKNRGYISARRLPTNR